MISLTSLGTLAIPFEFYQPLAIVMGIAFALSFGSLFMMQWMRSQRRMEAREEKKLELEIERQKLEAEKQDRGVSVVMNSEHDAALSAGTGSGGFIMVDMPDKDRPFFHDLLKGFEDYAKLKGYSIAFSIDATYDGRIGFKFTVKNDGIVVGPERVRQDFKEYVENIQTGEVNDLDHIPVIVNLAEHNYLVTQLKLRINFLQHSYKMQETTLKHYETLLTSARTFPALAAPSVVVQTGGNMETRHQLDSRSWNVKDSRNVNMGDDNQLTDNSINIGQSFNQRQERIAALDDLIGKIKGAETKNDASEKAEKSLTKVRDELADEAEPNEPMIKKWLENAKNVMVTGALSYEVIEAGKKLWEMFGM